MLDVESKLAACDIFEALSSSQISMLAIGCEVLPLDRGTTIYQEADLATHVYLLTSGRVQISHRDESGNRSILNWVSPGKLFGEFAVCQNDPREEQADLVEDSRMVAIPGESMRYLTRECPDISLQLLSVFASRRQNIERRIKSLMFRSTGHRLASLLLELAEPNGKPSLNESRVPRISHQDLAGMIGVARETVTITLGQLKTEGAIRIDNREIVINQPDLLTAFTLGSSRKKS